MRLNEQINEHLWDSLLCEILKENRRIELADLEASDETHTFSAEFKKNVSKIRLIFSIKAATGGVAAGMCKFVAASVIVMGIAFIGLLTQPKVYAAVDEVIRSVFADHDSYSSLSKSGDEAFNNDIRLGYVPEGYELSMIVYGGTINYLTYKNSDGQMIDFTYGFADGSIISTDNERHDYIEVDRGSQTYYLYNATEENDQKMILWYLDNYFYSIKSQLSEDELVQIAENVKI